MPTKQPVVVLWLGALIFKLHLVRCSAWSWRALPYERSIRFQTLGIGIGSSSDVNKDNNNEDPSSQDEGKSDSPSFEACLLNSDVAAQFRVLTCAATSCAKMRQRLNLEEYSTFSAFYARASETRITVEETSCLGQCQQSPCVAVEHEDYEGTVSLDGMTPAEFSNKVFQSVVDQNDVDRVWSCIVNAIEIMTEADGETDGEMV